MSTTRTSCWCAPAYNVMIVAGQHDCEMHRALHVAKTLVYRLEKIVHVGWQTDNWFSGYTSEQGGAVVGLSYLAAENPGLLADGAELTLMVPQSHQCWHCHFTHPTAPDCVD